MLLPALAAEIHLIDLDQPPESFPVLRHPVLRHQVADAMGEKPCPLVADVQLAREHHGRDALVGRTREINRAEPCAQRQVRALEWRAVQHGELVAAGLAVKVAGTSERQRLVDDPALRAHTSLLPAHALKMGEACLLVGVAIEEIHQLHADENRRSADASQ
jgi:hypothetical protein